MLADDDVVGKEVSQHLPRSVSGRSSAGWTCQRTLIVHDASVAGRRIEEGYPPKIDRTKKAEW